MMKSRLLAALALPLAMGIGACSDAPTAPGEVSLSNHGGPPAQPPGRRQGSGLVLDVVGDVTLPLGLGGELLTVQQAVITNIALVEQTVGGIVGLRATGTLTGTTVDLVSGLVTVETVPFVADLNVTSSGPGQCGLVNLSLSNLDLGALGLVDVTVPATVDVKGSGAVGVLLCNLGAIVGGLAGGLSGGGAGGIVNAINNQI